MDIAVLYDILSKLIEVPLRSAVRSTCLFQVPSHSRSISEYSGSVKWALKNSMMLLAHFLSHYHTKRREKKYISFFSGYFIIILVAHRLGHTVLFASLFSLYFHILFLFLVPTNLTNRQWSDEYPLEAWFNCWWDFTQWYTIISTYCSSLWPYIYTEK